MEFLDYNPRIDFTGYRELNYNRNLKLFLHKNIGATELCFLNSEILKTENILNELPVLTDGDLLEAIESKYTSKQKTDPDYKKAIQDLLEGSKRKYSRTRQRYINEIEDLNIKKNRLPQPLEIMTKTQSTNPFPEIFNGDDDRAFNVFKDFAIEVTDYYLDFSFIFQKMKGKKENLIKSNYRHKTFMKWLLENEFIKEKVYDDFLEKETFSTKADRGMRATRYYSIKNRHYPVITD
jgi:hypothetical protein